MLRVNRSSLPTAAICAAVFLGGCVSVREHTQVREQLVVEQQKALDRERRVRALEVLTGRLQKQLAIAELERAEAGSRLAAADRLLVLKPGDDVRRAAAAVEAGEDPAEGPVLAATILFPAGRDSLSDEDRLEVARVAEIVSSRKEARVVIGGHSDPAPIDRTRSRYRSNMQLSVVRALAVYHALLDCPGVDPARVVVVGYGEHRPAPGGPDSLRRVEIRILPGARAAPDASAVAP